MSRSEVYTHRRAKTLKGNRTVGFRSPKPLENVISPPNNSYVPKPCQYRLVSDEASMFISSLATVALFRIQYCKHRLCCPSRKLPLTSPPYQAKYHGKWYDHLYRVESAQVPRLARCSPYSISELQILSDRGKATWSAHTETATTACDRVAPPPSHV